MTVKIYTWDDIGNFSGTTTANPYEAMPPRSTSKKPETSEMHWNGDSWKHGVIERPESKEPAEPKVEVPVSVSPRQIRQAMNRTPFGNATLRDAVESAVATGDRDLQDWWEFSTAVERTNPQVTAMAQALGMDDASLDELWVLAGRL